MVSLVNVGCSLGSNSGEFSVCFTHIDLSRRTSWSILSTCCNSKNIWPGSGMAGIPNGSTPTDSIPGVFAIFVL